VGGPGDNGKAGAAWVFTRAGSTWAQQGSKLTGSGANGTTAGFGEGLALSSEGNTALIGGPGDYNHTGAAWVFFQSVATVVTEAASAVTQTSATVNATVNPNGIQVSECRFEYGPSTAYGQSAPCAQSPGSGTSPVPVSAALESLSEGATYHFRIAATDANGTSFGSDWTFTTLLLLGPHWYENGVRLGVTALQSGQDIIA